MGTDASSHAELRSIIDCALRGELTELLAARVYQMGPEATGAVMLASSARIGQQEQRIAELTGAREDLLTATTVGPHTPSGAIPPYAKPSIDTRRRGKPGARDGHRGHRRPSPPPERIARRESLEPLTKCPVCQGPVERSRRNRRRVIEDQAGWHVSKTLRLPDNITILLLPSHSPELNPVENLWHYLRSHRLSNRAYRDYDHLMAATVEAYRDLTPDLLQSVCRCPYLTHEEIS